MVGSRAAVLALVAAIPIGAGGCKNGGGGDSDDSTSSSEGTESTTSAGPMSDTTPTDTSSESTAETSVSTSVAEESSSSGSESTTGSGEQCSDGANEAGELCFAPFVQVLAGVPVAAIVAADVEDEAPSDADLVVGHNAGVTVLAGDGGGGFAATAEIDSGSVVALAVADLDDDGLRDIVAAHGESGRVSVAMNVQGTFGVAEDIALDVVPVASPSSVAIADFDGDTLPDIVAVDESAARLHLWLGVGGGSFADPLTLEIGGSPGEIAIGALGGSDAPDVAVPNLGGTSVAVLLFANGSFDIADSVLVGDGPQATVVIDFDDDGYDDLASADGAGDSASIVFGGANGLGSATTYVAGPEPRAIVAGDVDNDGAPDAVVSLESANAVAVFLQGDDGAFFAAQWVATPPQPGALALDDFNGDGLGDIAVASAAAQGGVSVLLSDP